MNNGDKGLSRVRRIKTAIWAAMTVRNWYQVCRSILGDTTVPHLLLRDGTVLMSPESVELWNHFNSIWNHRTYTLKYGIPKRGIVIDVGANVGLFSIYAARRAQRVYSYEPYPGNFAYLQRNVRGNALDNVEVFQIAVAGAPGVMSLNVGAATTASSVYGISNSTSSMDVRSITLPDIFEMNNIGCCDFLKMDCEGCEYEVLMNMPVGYLRRISVMSLEYHDDLTQYTHLDLLKYLSEHGFAPEVMSRDGAYGILVAKQL